MRTVRRVATDVTKAVLEIHSVTHHSGRRVLLLRENGRFHESSQVRQRPSHQTTPLLSRLARLITALALSTAACGPAQDESRVTTDADAVASVEYRSETGPYVDAPDRNMSMTVDAVDIAGDDVLVRLRVENRDDAYLDLGVENTIYGPLLVMRDDRGRQYDSYAVEPAGIPGRRVADLSFRLIGPLDPNAKAFTLELATQRGLLTSPSGPLPRRNGVRWRIDGPPTDTATSPVTDPDGTETVYAAAPRLPDLVHFWLETNPLSADR